MIIAALPLLFAAKPKVSAWVVGYNPQSVVRFEQRARQFDTVFMEYYTISADGSAIRRDRYRDTFAKARGIAKANGVEFFGMINNYAEDSGLDGFDPLRMTKALATKESREALVQGIVKLLKEDGAQGIDLDLESMKGDDRDRYSAFAASLSKALHREKMKLSITVHPKEEVKGGWDGVIAHDYKALGAVADRFNVMTYDFSWSTAPEGPIAPLDWVERVVNFTKTQVDPKKIGMGVACYGYNWSKNPAASLGWDDLTTKPTQVDPKSGEVVDGKVHFSGAEAFRRKYQLAQKLGIASVAFWYCGSEDPGIWDFLPIRK